MDCSLPGSSVHEIFQARKLERFAISFSRRSSRPRNQICIFYIGKRIFYHSATREADLCLMSSKRRNNYVIKVFLIELLWGKNAKSSFYIHLWGLANLNHDCRSWPSGLPSDRDSELRNRKQLAKKPFFKLLYLLPLTHCFFSSTGLESQSKMFLLRSC